MTADATTSAVAASDSADTGSADGVAAVLLRSARQALAGELAVPPSRASRTAAVLGRGALEAIISDESLQLGVRARVKTRTRLICLRVLGDPAVARLASLAWAGLSNACHHHSYELSPTAHEVAHLLDLVDQVLAATGAASHAAEKTIMGPIPRNSAARTSRQTAAAVVTTGGRHSLL